MKLKNIRVFVTLIVVVFWIHGCAFGQPSYSAKKWRHMFIEDGRRLKNLDISMQEMEDLLVAYNVAMNGTAKYGKFQGLKVIGIEVNENSKEDLGVGLYVLLGHQHHRAMPRRFFMKFKHKVVVLKSFSAEENTSVLQPFIEENKDKLTEKQIKKIKSYFKK